MTPSKYQKMQKQKANFLMIVASQQLITQLQKRLTVGVNKNIFFF
jgi:hypothetical protein